jgi:hypothetical protein
MSFKGVYAVADAWQRSGWDGGFAWRLLLWLMRNADDKSMTVIRSQLRLSEEFGVSDRHIRTHLAAWRERGVLRLIEHGGGSRKKPAKYSIDLEALKLYSLQQADERVRSKQRTAEAHEFQVAGSLVNSGMPYGSTIANGSQEVCGLPESAGKVGASGVDSRLRKSDDSTAELSMDNTGTPGVPTLQRVIESKSDISQVMPAKEKVSSVGQEEPSSATGKRFRPASNLEAPVRSDIVSRMSELLTPA